MTTSETVVPTRWNHTPKTWEKRQQFADILGKACATQGVALEWLDEEQWTGVMRAPNGRSAPVYGYDLGLNSAAAAKIADSKADTYALLRYSGVPAIQHERVTPHVTDGTKLTFQQRKELALARIGLPMVLKPDAGYSSGNGVELCKTEEDVAAYMQAAGTTPTAASPFRKFDEFRVVVLDGEARGVIAKHLDPSGWMHNQSKGSKRSLLDRDSELYPRLGALGVTAADALDLCFATVDITREHETMDLAVLEANDAVSVVYPSHTDMGQFGREVYADAVALRLGT
ncbi:MAG TPA: hypothetical protein VJ843_01995 [Candidatus Saccharimonadales bacterium]|nr:hypothetical protein [Candidatus Saccharimonadales bacterium]